MQQNSTTVYELLDNYSPKLQTLIHETERFASSILRVTTLLTGAAATALFSFTKSAVTEAAKVDRLTYTFAALSGSMETATEKMRWLREFSLRSIGQFDDLAEAGTLLEASGLNMQRFLPSISNIAGAFGGAKEQVLELATAFSRFASGTNFGESMRVLRRFGIGIADFMKEGLSVSPSGQIKASTEQALAALEGIAKRKFGEIGELARNEISVKFSNLHDAWNQMLDGFGKGWFPFITEVLQSLQPFIQFLTSSGLIEEMGRNWANAIKSITGIDEQGGGGGLPRFLSYLVAVMSELPNLFMNVGNFIKGFIQTTAQNVVEFINFFLTQSTILYNGVATVFNFISNQIIDTVNIMTRLVTWAINQMLNVAHQAATIIAPGMGFFPAAQLPDAFAVPHVNLPIQNAPQPFKNATDIFEKMFGGLGDAFGSFQSSIGTESNRIYTAFMNRDQTQGKDNKLYSMFNDSFTPLAKETAENTATIAKNTTDFSAMLKRYVVGGGPLAQIGVTPSELGVARAGGGTRSINVQVGSKHLTDAMSEIVEQVVNEMVRQGLRIHQ